MIPQIVHSGTGIEGKPRASGDDPLGALFLGPNGG